MNKTDIEWADYTWNPVTGCLGPDNDGVLCVYCYAKDIARRFAGTPSFPNGFKPTNHEDRLTEPVLKRRPSRIFVGSMTDMFGVWVTDRMLEDVLAICRLCPQHTFMFLTKQPSMMVMRLAPFLARDYRNIWLGTTCTNKISAQDAALFMDNARRSGWHTFVSVEPMMECVHQSIGWAEWIIVGGMTGGYAKKIHYQAKKEDINCMIAIAMDYHVPIFLKKNLGHDEHIQRVPEEQVGVVP